MAKGVEIAGLVELGETLDILPQKVERKFIRRSIGKGAQIFKEAVKSHAPRITGRLFKAVSVKQLRPGSGSFTELIGFAFKGILAKKVGKVRNPARTQRSGPGTEDPGVYSKFVETGTFNTPARPFVRPAFEETKNKVTEVVGQDLMEQIEQELH
jgi:HK97 gp10 family phage protein